LSKVEVEVRVAAVTSNKAVAVAAMLLLEEEEPPANLLMLELISLRTELSLKKARRAQPYYSALDDVP